MYEAQTKQLLYLEFNKFNFTAHRYPNAIGLWKNEQESLLWYGLNSDPNHNWMEIGSFCGGSAVLLCLAKKKLQKAPTSKVVSVDRNFTMNYDETANKQFDRNLSFFPGLSTKVGVDSLQLASHYDGSPLSLAFIDGWHSFKGAYLDFLCVEPWLTPNATVLFHDVAQQPYENKEHLEIAYESAVGHYEEWMEEKLPNPKAQEQDYHLDEVVAYIIKKHGCELIDNPMLNGSKNCMVGLKRKTV